MRDPSRLQHVGKVGHRKSLIGHLLYEKDSEARLPKGPDRVEDVASGPVCDTTSPILTVLGTAKAGLPNVATAPAAPIPLSSLRRATLEFTFVTISAICVFAFFVAYQAAAVCSRRTIVVGAPATSLTTLKLNLMRANGALRPAL